METDPETKAQFEAQLKEMKAQIEVLMQNIGNARQEAGQNELRLGAQIKALESELRGIGFCSHNFDTEVGEIHIPASQFVMLGASIAGGAEGGSARLNQAKGVAVLHACQRCKAIFWSGKFKEGAEVEALVSVSDAKTIFREELNDAIRGELPALLPDLVASSVKALPAGKRDEDEPSSKSRRSNGRKRA